MYLPIVTLHPATLNEFDYIYGLCELTMRGFVEADLGDCFERIARPTITALLAKGLFSTLQKNGERVGAIALEQKDSISSWRSYMWNRSARSAESAVRP